MHDWSSNWPHFGDVGDAADYIGQFCRRWGFITVSQTKEKYGTARVYVSFSGCPNMHNIFWPSHHYIRWEQYLGKFGEVLYWIDNKIVDNIIYYSGINYIFVPYQRFIYRLAYKRAFKKYPHIKKEIKHGCDFPELLKGLCTRN